MVSRPVLGLTTVIGLGALAFAVILLILAQLFMPGDSAGPSQQESTPVDAVGPIQHEAPLAPSRLTQGTWHWQRTERGDGTTVVSVNPDKFTISFGADGRFNLKTDCNGAGGRYTVSGSQLTFEKAPMTAMGCPQLPQPSQEWVFHGAVGDTASYAFDGEQLVLYLKQDGGHIVLTPRPA